MKHETQQHIACTLTDHVGCNSYAHRCKTLSSTPTQQWDFATCAMTDRHEGVLHRVCFIGLMNRRGRGERTSSLACKSSALNCGGG